MTINKKGLDRFLLRSSNLAQIAVAILAIYGYFFTVVPIYQKEVLAEEIAKKQLDIDKLVKTNDDLTREIENKKSELAFVNNKSEVIILRNNELEHKNKILEQSNNDLSMEIDKRGQVLAELTHVMEVKFVDYFATMLKKYALTQYTYKNIMTPQPGNDPLESGESFIKNVIIPYDIVKACIYRDDDKEFYEKTEAIPEPIKHYVYCSRRK